MRITFSLLFMQTLFSGPIVLLARVRQRHVFQIRIFVDFVLDEVPRHSVVEVVVELDAGTLMRNEDTNIKALKVDTISKHEGLTDYTLT